MALTALGATGAAAAGAALPDGRVYEVVSPAQKNGGDVLAYSPRTRASASGDAIEYESLTGYGDVHGSGVTVAYIARRTPTGWVSHAITPLVGSNSVKGLLVGADAYYVGDFTSDLGQGVFFSPTSLTADANVRDVYNLYRVNDLNTPGSTSLDLLSNCPLCASSSRPLDPVPGQSGAAQSFVTALAGGSPDFGHIAFESIENLTADAPAQPPLCGTANAISPPPAPPFCRLRLYEWDHGTVRLVGILPDGRGADISFGGAGARNLTSTPHTVSDGSDGHSRIFFTQSTDANGNTASQLDENDPVVQQTFGQGPVNYSGNVFMRVDHAMTIRLNRSERTGLTDAFAPAQYLDASADGERVFFMTRQALTDDATAGNTVKLYMYDATKPDSAPDNLTLVSHDDEPGDGLNADAQGMIGASDDGHYVYMAVDGQLVRGKSRAPGVRLYLWHDGQITHIGGPIPGGDSLNPNLTDVPGALNITPRQGRVTPDGQHMVFTTTNGASIGGYDHGRCLLIGCREVYVYSAATRVLACASCNPTRAPATVDADVPTQGLQGGARVTSHDTRGLSDDGRYVFFSSAEALVPQDTNGRSDAYEYNTVTRTVSLLSSGTAPEDSWYVDNSADGRDVFIVTNQRLVGQDTDDNYDVYDARIGGGYPAPPTAPLPCTPGSCQGALTAAPLLPGTASASYTGAGNAKTKLKKPRTTVHCRRGYTKRRVHGKTTCIRKPHRHARTTRSRS